MLGVTYDAICVCDAQARKKHLQDSCVLPVHFRQEDLNLEPICPHPRHTEPVSNPGNERREGTWKDLGERVQFSCHSSGLVTGFIPRPAGLTDLARIFA